MTRLREFLEKTGTERVPVVFMLVDAIGTTAKRVIFGASFPPIAITAPRLNSTGSAYSGTAIVAARSSTLGRCHCDIGVEYYPACNHYNNRKHYEYELKFFHNITPFLNNG